MTENQHTQESTDESATINADESTSTRRRLLAGAAAAAGASVAAAALGTKSAEAIDGDPVTVGGSFTGASTTTIESTDTSTAFSAVNLFNTGIGILGVGDGNLGKGVRGTSDGNGGNAVEGLATGNLAIGVAGDGLDGALGTGVRGRGNLYGVRGESQSASGIGVLGEAEGNGAAIAATGRVSIVPAGETGNTTPEAPLHIRQVNSPDAVELLLQLESTVPPQQIFENSTTGAKWFFAMTSDDQFKISRDGTGTVEAKFFDNGNLVIGGTLSQSSDVAIKHDFDTVDPSDVLDAVESMPVTTWRYNTSPDEVHMGPTSQDFAAAFGLGSDRTKIAAVDADGVAFASIKALRQENRQLRAELDELRDLVIGMKDR